MSERPGRRSERARRGRGWDLSALSTPPSANFERTGWARTFPPGDQREFEILGLRSVPLSPGFKIPIKKQNNSYSKLALIPPVPSTPGTMKAAVDLKPTLTIIKTEKVDLELFPSPGEWQQ